MCQKQLVENKVIKLIYRGTNYNYDLDRVRANNSPLPHFNKSAYKLIYRGSVYRFDPAMTRPEPAKPSSYKLIYRGCTYQVQRNEKGEVSYKSKSH